MRPVLAATVAILSLSVPALAQPAIPSLPKEMMGIWGFEDEGSCDSKESDFRMSGVGQER